MLRKIWASLPASQKTAVDHVAFDWLTMLNVALDSGTPSPGHLEPELSAKSLDELAWTEGWAAASVVDIVAGMSLSVELAPGILVSEAFATVGTACMSTAAGTSCIA